MMTTTTRLLMPATENTVWGYWGSMQEDAAAGWPIAMQAIAGATDQPLDSVRAFLDSRHGRHFADEVRNGLHRGQTLEVAIQTATHTWMGWTINRRMSRDYGIPVGLPYLLGFVIQAAIDEELAESALTHATLRQ
jgi:hypothetical protein